MSTLPAATSADTSFQTLCDHRSVETLGDSQTTESTSAFNLVDILSNKTNLCPGTL